MNLYMKPTITLINGNIPFVFTVPPVDFTDSKTMGNIPVEIVDIGQDIRSGKRNMDVYSWSGFLPSIESRFYDPILNPLGSSPSKLYLETLMKKSTILFLVIPEYPLFVRCKIDSLRFESRDHSGDIYYSITLVQEGSGLGVVDKLTGLFKRG